MKDPPSSSDSRVFRSAAEDVPWVETREGGLFFVNALLVAPELCVLLPLALGAGLRAIGVLGGPSEILDTIPRVAAFVLPWVGWLLVFPIWVTVRGIRGVETTGIRLALVGFLALHLGFFGYTLMGWIRALGG